MSQDVEAASTSVRKVGRPKKLPASAPDASLPVPKGPKAAARRVESPAAGSGVIPANPKRGPRPSASTHPGAFGNTSPSLPRIREDLSVEELKALQQVVLGVRHALIDRLTAHDVEEALKASAMEGMDST